MDPSGLEPSQPPVPAVSLPVEYQSFAGGFNQDLKGKGEFSALEGSRFRFTGQNRAVFSGGPAELIFGASEIRNVALAGNGVQFSTPSGRSGRRHKPFIFFCRNPAEAALAAGLLPRTLDQDFVAGVEFHQKLRSLPGAQRDWATVTNLIIALNVAVFVVMAAFLGAGWVDVTDMHPYIVYGANNGAATTDGQWWRLLTSMFMHFGILHLALNMWALFQSGRLVERLQGRVLYAVTYLASGVGGGLLSIGWHGDKMWSAGASGAIFGVYGALLGHMLKEKHALPRAVFQPIMKSTLLFAGYNLVYGMVNTSIDNAAHIGGFLTGIALGWLTAMPPDLGLRSRLVARKLALACGFFALMIAVGVRTVPRFGYSVEEELAWNGAVSGFAAQEGSLVERLNSELTRWEKSADNGPAFAPFIDGELEPFYLKFRQALTALDLKPERATGQRRATLVSFLDLREESFQHLSRAVRQNDPEEFKSYERLETEAAGLLASLKQKP